MNDLIDKMAKMVADGLEIDMPFLVQVLNSAKTKVTLDLIFPDWVAFTRYPVAIVVLQSGKFEIFIVRDDGSAGSIGCYRPQAIECTRELQGIQATLAIAGQVHNYKLIFHIALS